MPSLCSCPWQRAWPFLLRARDPAWTLGWCCHPVKRSPLPSSSDGFHRRWKTTVKCREYLNPRAAEKPTHDPVFFGVERLQLVFIDREIPLYCSKRVRNLMSGPVHSPKTSDTPTSDQETTQEGPVSGGVVGVGAQGQAQQMQNRRM